MISFDIIIIIITIGINNDITTIISSTVSPNTDTKHYLFRKQ